MDNQQKISDLSSLSIQDITGSENVAMSTPKNNNGYESKKNSFSRLGSWFNNCFNFNNLNTQSKNIIGAINENVSGGIAIPNSAPAHNAIYRGKWLGIAPSEAQYQAIYDGTFEDLYIGDFWSEDPNDATKTRWRIAGFNYYYGTGPSNYVTTNHAVIIPDLPIVDQSGSKMTQNSGLAYNTGYKYCVARGYASENGSYSLSEGNVIRTNHIPTSVIAVFRTGESVYDNPNFDYQHDTPVDNPSLIWHVSSFGEDPDNPGHGIIRLDGTFRDFYTSVMDVGGIPTHLYPNQWYAKIDYSSFQVYYTYYTGIGGLVTAKNIIEETFGSEHIMHHQVPLSVYKHDWPYQSTYDLACKQVDFKYEMEWTDVTVELPTMASIFGNNAYSAYQEYSITENARLKIRNKSGYQINTNAANPDSERGIIRYGSNSAEAHIENYQLPLFIYDPNLIHPSGRYGYVLRNLACCDEAFAGEKWHANIGSEPDYGGGWIYTSQHHRYSTITHFGIPAADYESGTYYMRGIRPMFCISATSNPHES